MNRLIVGFAFLFALAACKQDEPLPQQSTTIAVTTPAPAPSATPSAPSPLAVALDAIMKTPSLTEALAIAKPKMVDTAESLDDGTFLLGMWAMKWMSWGDFNIPKGETSFALAQKDPDEARGKRLCVSGSIVRIEVEKNGDTKRFLGVLVAGSNDAWRFIAVGSSGSLVQHNHARICGVVTSKNDYQNSAGGTAHAVRIVGMFDLPENHTAAQ